MEPNQPNQPQYQQTVIIVGKQKSVGVAFILAFFFGPLGLLYASVTGGIVMFFVGIIVAIITLGFGLILVWISCIIWAVVAANNANSKVASGAGANMNFSTAPAQQQPTNPTPIVQPQPVQPIVQSPPQNFQAQPQYVEQKQSESNAEKNNDLSLNTFSDWVTDNKKGLMFIIGGIVIILVLTITVKYVMNLDFSKSKPENNQNYAVVGKADSAKMDSVGKGNNSTSINNINYYNNGHFTGAWFEVTVPSDFSARPSMKSKSAAGYESAFFESPDKEVEFYVFSPQWGGEADDIAINNSTEKINSTSSQKSKGNIITWSEIQALDGSYFRAYQDTKNQIGNIHWIIGLKYKSRIAYDRYKPAYLSFKKSLIQHAD